VLDFLFGHLGFNLLGLCKGIMVELRLKSSRSFQTLSLWEVFSLHGFVVHHYFGMELSFIGLFLQRINNQINKVLNFAENLTRVFLYIA